MLIHELTPAECREILSHTNVARLACSRADQPYIVPISFAYDPDSEGLFSFSMVGRKVAWMRDNPKVCVEVEDIGDRFHWTTVVIFGHYQEIERSPAHSDIRKRALDLFEQRTQWWLPGAGKLTAREDDEVVVYRIHIASITGRRAAHDRA